VAKFSQTFLQGLLQPSYQQGLFEAARGVGQTPNIMRLQREREEKARMLSTMGPVDLADLAIQEAVKTGDQGKVLAARQAKQNVVTDQSRSRINQLEIERQAALAAGDDAEAQRIEDVMKQSAVDGNLSSTELASISGRTAKGIQARNDALYIRKQRAATAAKEAEQTMIDTRAAGIARSNQPINEAVNAIEGLDEGVRAQILEKATNLRKMYDANREAVQAQDLGPFQKQYLKDNKNLINNPSVKDALSILGAPTAAPGAKRKAVKDIASVIEADFTAKEQERNSKDRVELDATLAINHMSGLESPSEGVIGQDLIELLNDEYEIGTDNYKKLVDGITSLMIEKPELRNNPEQAVAEGLNLITGGRPGFDPDLESGRQEASVAKAEKRAAYKQELIAQGMSESEAEAQIREDEARASRYRARTTQGM
jgi:hypothetical protein